MTGAYVRVKRDGEFKAIEIEHLTDAEREVFFENHAFVPWMNLVCKKLAETETLLSKVMEKVNVDLSHL